MTKNQNDRFAILESRRHSLEMERLQGEAQTETARHQRAVEAETAQHNRATEALQSDANVINLRNVTETERKNRASEDIQWANTNEAIRHDKEQEGVAWLNAAINAQNAETNAMNAKTNYLDYGERVRHNQVVESQAFLDYGLRQDQVNSQIEVNDANVGKTEAETVKIGVDTRLSNAKIATERVKQVTDSINTIVNVVEQGRKNAESVINALTFGPKLLGNTLGRVLSAK